MLELWLLLGPGPAALAARLRAASDLSRGIVVEDARASRVLESVRAPGRSADQACGLLWRDRAGLRGHQESEREERGRSGVSPALDGDEKWRALSRARA